MKHGYLLGIFGKTPNVKLLMCLLNSSRDETSDTLIKGAGINRNKGYELIRELELSEIVIRTRTMGRIRMYSINKDHPFVKALIRYEKSIPEARICEPTPQLIEASKRGREI